MIETRCPRPLASAVLAAVLTTMAVVAGSLPATAIDQPWLKPGTPFRYERADPTVAMLGPIMYSYATNHGGSDFPLVVVFLDMDRGFNCQIVEPACRRPPAPPVHPSAAEV